MGNRGSSTTGYLSILSMQQLSLTEPPLDGWLLLDKPVGISSAQCLNWLKRKLRATLPPGTALPKIGHGGTLDPLASGVLPVALGEATKTVNYVMTAAKTYLFTIQFGVSSPSLDCGSECKWDGLSMPAKDVLQAVISRFVGPLEQVPPIYSALNVKGQRAYKLARAGCAIELPSRKVNCFSLRLISYKKSLHKATFIACVGKGFYIRSLARDIAKGCCSSGIISYLRRIELAGFSKKPLLLACNLYTNNSLPLREFLVPTLQALDDIPVLQCSEQEALNLYHGKTNSLPSAFRGAPGTYKVVWAEKLVSIVKIDAQGLRILRNFNYILEKMHDVD